MGATVKEETPLEAALRQCDEAQAEVERLRDALVFWKFCAERQILAVQSITALPYLGYAQARADAALAATVDAE
jgi:hypothetical protein